MFGAIASASHLLTVFSLSPEHAVFLLGTKFQLLPLSVLFPRSRMFFLCSALCHSPVQLSTPPKGLPRLPKTPGVVCGLKDSALPDNRWILVLLCPLWTLSSLSRSPTAA